MNYEKSCGVLVVKDYKYILMIKHKKGGHWAFPKGHVEEGETEIQTALREVFEETGLQVEIIGDFKETVTYSPKKGVTKDVVYFLGKYKGGEFNMQLEEIKDITWMPIWLAKRKATFANDKTLIAKFIKEVDKLKKEKQQKKREVE